MKLSILIPFRDADGTRTPAKEWIVKRWAHFYPDAEIIEAPDDGVDPFNKSMAVNDAARQATGDVFAILDADTWVDPPHVERSLSLIEKGIPWVIPARRNLRLNRTISEKLLRLDPTGPLPPLRSQDADTAMGPVVGFLWIIPRKNWEIIGGMDERIRGWGGEDTAFTRAMDVIVGYHRKLNGTVVCLWHDRPRDRKRNRVWVGQDRTQEQYKQALIGAYFKAGRSKEAMLRVVQGIHDPAPITVPVPREPGIPSLAAQATMPRRVNWLEIREKRRAAR